ncbi:MAG: hypothetical protein PHR24_04670, partial [Oscillospiraceae bacterium]|nr:hypothetical protein [Oscillospiraceae bacterium]
MKNINISGSYKLNMDNYTTKKMKLKENFVQDLVQKDNKYGLRNVSILWSPLKTPSGVFRHNFRRTASNLLVRRKALLRRFSLSDKNSAR